jgi:hypothetical protein
MLHARQGKIQIQYSNLSIPIREKLNYKAHELEINGDVTTDDIHGSFSA